MSTSPVIENNVLDVSLQKFLASFGLWDSFGQDFLTYLRKGEIGSRLAKELRDNKKCQKAMDLIVEAQISSLRQMGATGLFSEPDDRVDQETLDIIFSLALPVVQEFDLKESESKHVMEDITSTAWKMRQQVDMVVKLLDELGENARNSQVFDELENEQFSLLRDCADKVQNHFKAPEKWVKNLASRVLQGHVLRKNTSVPAGIK